MFSLRVGRGRPAALAGLLHLCPLLLLIQCAKVEQPMQQTNKLQSKDKPILFVAISELGTQQCANSYVGLGILSDSEGKILTVSPNSPAFRAGMREGDVVQELLNIWPGMYPIGHVLELNGLRDGKTISYIVITGDVCYE